MRSVLLSDALLIIDFFNSRGIYAVSNTVTKKVVAKNQNLNVWVDLQFVRANVTV